MIFGAVGLASAQNELGVRLALDEAGLDLRHDQPDAFLGGDPHDPKNYLDKTPEGIRRRGEVQDMVRELLDKMPGADAKWKWKDSYGNGWGEPLQICRSGKVQIGQLCYDRCPSGYYRRKGTFDCWQYCPRGFRDDGNYCRKAEYGRGIGYAWWNWDDCERDHGSCERWGAIYYPKCKWGYENFGCCICRPKSFRCSDYGLGHQVDISCHKRVLHSPGLSGKICKPGYYQSGLLCYPNCKSGFHGVGPVCWSNVPRGWHDCGVFYANTKANCFLGPVHDVFSAVIQIPAVVVDTTIELGKCLVDHAKNIKDKTCSWKDVTGGCSMKKIDGGFKVGCPIPPLQVGVEFGAQQVAGGNEFVTRGTMGNPVAFERSWTASPMKDHVYMYGNFEWSHTDDIELALQNSKFHMQLPGSKFNLDTAFAVYNPDADVEYNPCHGDSCIIKLNEGKEKIVETTIAIATFPLLVELDAAIRLHIKPQTMNMPKFQLHAKVNGPGIPVLKTTQIDLHQNLDGIMKQLEGMVDVNALQRAVETQLELCVKDSDEFIEDMKNEFARKVEEAMEPADASIFTMQIKEVVEAKLDVCVGVDVRLAVNGIGAYSDVEVCFEAKVDATFTADVGGVNVDWSVTAVMLPADAEIEFKVPATAITDFTCALSQLAEVQIASKCIPFLECGRKFAEDTCKGVMTQVVNAHGLEGAEVKNIQPYPLTILEKQFTIHNESDSFEYANPSEAMIKQVAALGLDPIKILKDAEENGMGYENVANAIATLSKYYGRRRLQANLAGLTSFIPTDLSAAKEAIAQVSDTDAAKNIAQGLLPSGVPDIYKTVVKQVATKHLQKFESADVGGMPLKDALEILEDLSNGNYKELVDDLLDNAGLSDMLQGLDCGGSEWTLIVRQTMPYTWTKGQLSLNAKNPNADNYAIADRVTEFKSGGGYKFKLVWPEDSEGTTYEWYQTSNPFTEQVKGYKAIDVPYTGRYWGGLEPSGYALVDGSVRHSNWFYAVGSYITWQGAYPAYAKSDSDNKYPQRKVELYVQAAN